MNPKAALLLLAASVPASAFTLERLEPRRILDQAAELPPAPKILDAGPAPAALPGGVPIEPRSGRFTVAPDWSLTPGVLCTTRDKDFHEFRYPERIPYCQRNTSREDKQEVSRWYGVPWEEHSKYQYDHLLSLCLGGSNNLRNLWPMEVAQARRKAGMEFQLCERLRKGEITQRDAVAQELGWFSENDPAAYRALTSPYPD